MIFLLFFLFFFHLSTSYCPTLLGCTENINLLFILEFLNIFIYLYRYNFFNITGIAVEQLILLDINCVTQFESSLPLGQFKKNLLVILFVGQKVVFERVFLYVM